MKTVLITGASRGIGKALTGEFLRHGWYVFAGMRAPEKAEIPQNLASASTFKALALDVTSDASVVAAAEEVRKAVGNLQVLVNNAAIFPEEGKESLAEMKLEWFREAFETNVVGVARMIQNFRPLLLEGGRIVNISSGAGSISAKDNFDYYAYSTSKAALNMLTRAVAAELAPHRITVVAVSPGWVRTEMGGSHAPLSAEESAQSLVRTISNLTQKQSGSFLGKDGASLEYQW